MKRSGRLAAGLVLILISCAGTPHPAPYGPSTETREDRGAYPQIRRLLDQGGPQLDHARLMEIYAAMAKTPQPIAGMHDLLAAMIRKRNHHPRVDQMILIFAAKTIGESRFSIAGADDLFDAMLDQPERLNEWVIAFVADAIGRYPHTLVRGDQLVDRLDAQLRRLRHSVDPADEMFGYHFLPPPRHPLIIAYLSGIADPRRRMHERDRYYALIRHHIAEEDIAASLAVLKARAQAGMVPSCPLIMQCLLKKMDRLPLQ